MLRRGVARRPAEREEQEKRLLIFRQFKCISFYGDVFAGRCPYHGTEGNYSSIFCPRSHITSLVMGSPVHTRARSHTHTHTHTHLIFCIFLLRYYGLALPPRHNIISCIVSVLPATSCVFSITHVSSVAFRGGKEWRRGCISFWSPSHQQ